MNLLKYFLIQEALQNYYLVILFLTYSEKC